MLRRRLKGNVIAPRKKSDKSLFFLAIILTLLGLVVIADVSAPLAQASFGDSFYFVKQQALWAVIGIVVLVISSNIHHSFWKRLAPIVFFFSIISLIVVLVPGVGSKFLGARRWIILGPVNFQPSEFVKLSLALILAYFYDKNLPYYVYIIAIGLVGGLIMGQPDLGTTIVVATIGLTQLFLAGISLPLLLGVLGGGGLVGGLLIMLSDYRRQRLLTYLKMAGDPLAENYHVRQILIALGSGGLFGVGLGASRQKYLFLPETATDSVFAVVAEEVGFVGGAILICLLTFFVLKAIKIAKNAPDRFSSLLAAGIAAWLGGQSLLNLASMTSLVPLTGIPLPFFSYGGSSLVMILFGVGVLVNISKYAKGQYR